MKINPIKLTHAITLTGYFGLMAGIYAWHVWLGDTPDHAISVILLLQLGPLMFPLRGLLHGRVYTHAWSLYLAIFYFVVGVWYAGAAEDRPFGMYVIACSMLFFTGALFYTRTASRQPPAGER